MRLLALLALPWAILSLWIGPVVYLLGPSLDALIAASLPIIIGLTVNARTIAHIFREDVEFQDQIPDHQEPESRQTWANLNRKPRRT